MENFFANKFLVFNQKHVISIALINIQTESLAFSTFYHSPPPHLHLIQYIFDFNYFVWNCFETNFSALDAKLTNKNRNNVWKLAFFSNESRRLIRIGLGTNETIYYSMVIGQFSKNHGNYNQNILNSMQYIVNVVESMMMILRYTFSKSFEKHLFMKQSLLLHEQKMNFYHFID